MGLAWERGAVEEGCVWSPLLTRPGDGAWHTLSLILTTFNREDAVPSRAPMGIRPALGTVTICFQSPHPVRRELFSPFPRQAN